MAVFSATYVANNQFTVSGDVRTYFPVNVAIRASCGGIWVYSIVDAVSYSTNTTVTIKTTDLSSPITAVEVSTIHPWGIPWHNHEDYLSGGDEVVGSPPDHSWLNNTIRFKNPDGSWGSYYAVGFRWRDEWLTSTSYAAYDCVLNDGAAYICTVAHSSDATTEPGEGTYWDDYWDLMAAGLTWRAAWTLSTAYVALDIVTNDGSAYICVVAHTSDSTTEPGTGTYWEDYWDLLVEQGATGPAGPQGIQGLTGSTGPQGDPGLVWEGAWVGSTLYAIGDAVSNEGSSYICTAEHTSDASSEPGIGTYWADYWDLLAETGTGAEFNWQGEWQTSTPYTSNDAVWTGATSNSSFICILDHTSGTTSEPVFGASWETYWSPITYGFLYTGQWTDSEIYWPNAMVLATDGSIYICVTLHTAGATTEPGVGIDWETYWVQILAGMFALGDWQTSTDYIINNVVGNGGDSYICIVDHTSDASTEPGVGTYWADYWAVFAQKGVDGTTNVTIEGVAGEALSQYDVVYSDAADSGEWKKAQRDGTEAESKAKGLVIEVGGISNASTGTILLFGLVQNAAWSFTSGNFIYLDTAAGAMTETDPMLDANAGQYCVELALALPDDYLFWNPRTPYLI